MRANVSSMSARFVDNLSRWSFPLHLGFLQIFQSNRHIFQGFTSSLAICSFFASQFCSRLEQISLLKVGSVTARTKTKDWFMSIGGALYHGGDECPISRNRFFFAVETW